MRFYYICIYSVQLITFVLFSITDLLIELENYKDYSQFKETKLFTIYQQFEKEFNGLPFDITEEYHDEIQYLLQTQGLSLK